jgi:antirestriction protein ArdC
MRCSQQSYRKQSPSGGEDIELEIPYMKGYTVFNVEQIEGLPEIYYAKAAPTRDAESYYSTLAHLC